MKMTVNLFRRTLRAEKRSRLNAYQREWTDRNREHRRAKDRERYRRQGPKAYAYRYHLKCAYGITAEDYEKILAEQGGKCGACGTERCRQFGKLSVDHDHATGRVRGVLCNDCNRALGQVRDSISALEGLVAYLKGRSGT